MRARLARLECLWKGHSWWIEGYGEQHGWKTGTLFCIHCGKLHPSEAGESHKHRRSA